MNWLIDLSMWNAVFWHISVGCISRSREWLELHVIRTSKQTHITSNLLGPELNCTLGPQSLCACYHLTFSVLPLCSVHIDSPDVPTLTRPHMYMYIPHAWNSMLATSKSRLLAYTMVHPSPCVIRTGYLQAHGQKMKPSVTHQIMHVCAKPNK